MSAGDDPRRFVFLATGARSPFSGLRWSMPSRHAPGDWVAEPGLRLCRPTDLAHWLHDELWEAEPGGDVRERTDGLLGSRARLVRRIDAWNPVGAARFAEACWAHAASAVADASDAARERVRGYLDDALTCARGGYPAVGAFSAAVAVAKIAAAGAIDDAYRRERGWQAAWIVRELIGP